jgi:hypothetical protein
MEGSAGNRHHEARGATILGAMALWYPRKLMWVCTHYTALGHQVNDLKPRAKREMRILKDRFGNDGKPIPVSIAAAFVFANPTEWTSLQCIHFLALADQ